MSEWGWLAFVLPCAINVGVQVVLMVRAIRRDRAHLARLDAAWAETEVRLEQINSEADQLHGRVKADAKRFRETFGIEAIPEGPQAQATWKGALDPRNRVN